jgi:hypothetical protein
MSETTQNLVYNFNVTIDRQAINNLSLTDQTTLREELLNTINEYGIILLPANPGKAGMNHWQDLTQDLYSVISVVDEAIENKIGRYVRIQMPDGSNALTHDPCKELG